MFKNCGSTKEFNDFVKILTSYIESKVMWKEKTSSNFDSFKVITTGLCYLTFQTAIWIYIEPQRKIGNQSTMIFLTVIKINQDFFQIFYISPLPSLLILQNIPKGTAVCQINSPKVILPSNYTFYIENVRKWWYYFLSIVFLSIYYGFDELL